MIRSLARIDLEAPLRVVSGSRPLLARVGALYEIRYDSLLALPLPHEDCLPLAMDGSGRLLASRESGDRLIRRYRGGTMDATFPLIVDEVLSLAVDGDRVIAVKRDGTAVGFGEDTVPQVDFAWRLGARFRSCDARDGTIALAGAETVLCDFQGRVLERMPGASKGRFARNGLWRLENRWTTEHGTLDPEALGLAIVDDLVGDWAVGEALVRFEF